MEGLKQLHRERYLLLAVASLLVLLAAAVLVAFISERSLKEQTAREAGAQADLLASAVSGALAFNDQAAAQDYVDAVQINPNVLAAAIYGPDGRVFASFVRRGETTPAAPVSDQAATVFSNGELDVVRPVEEAGQRLGKVHLRLLDMPQAQRFGRYAGQLVLLGLAVLVVLVLAAAQGALRRANKALADRAEDLAEANRLLHQQMLERQRAEEALRQSQKMEAIGRLTGGIAHDFNNLLMVTSSGIDLMERTENPDRRRMLSDGIRQAVARGAALTRQLLAFSRRAPLKMQVLELRQQIEGLRFLFERSLREDIEVVLDLSPDLWPIEVDPGELELSLLNLAVNARDAMPEGGRLTISAVNIPATSDGRDMVCIKVADNGGGMPESVALRVFEPFFTTKEVGRGTGLGLSQVYGFVHASGGDVSVTSGEGAGAVFSLCLPRTLKPVPAPSPAKAAVPESAPVDARVLLVEDDDAVAAAVGHMLRDLGYRYLRVGFAEEALVTLARDQGFDLVMSDMVMPGTMDGLALAKEIRHRHPDLPVLLSTGFSEAATAAGEENFLLLLKPYGIADLASTLGQLRQGASQASAPDPA